MRCLSTREVDWSDGQTLPDPGRPAIELLALLRSQGPSLGEARWLSTHATSDPAHRIASALLSPDLQALANALTAPGSDEALAVFTRDLAGFRLRTLKDAQGAQDKLQACHEDARRRRDGDADAERAASRQDLGDLPSVMDN